MELQDELLKIEIEGNVISQIIAINAYDASVDGAVDLTLQIKNPDKNIELEAEVEADSTYVFEGALSVPYGSVITLKGGRGNKLHGKIKIEKQKA